MNNLVDIIKKNGIVGAGGAGFPSHVKVNGKAEYIIVNGAECEPLLRVDQQLMSVQTVKIIEALEAVRIFTGAREGIIGLKSKYKSAIRAINENNKYSNIRIHELGNFYPAGDEQILVYETIGKIVPEGGIPLAVGAMVFNVETLVNIYEAINNETPVVEKYITVTGEVKNPITVKVPIGVTVKEVLDLAGGVTVSDFFVINGGPMMGKIVNNINDPITKATKGLIVLDKKHSLVATLKKDMSNMLREAKTACMHCSLCSEICPRNMIGHNINPHKLIRMASYNSTCENDTTATNAFLCCECRLCQYACVMDLQPWKLHYILKGKLGEMGIKNPHCDIPSDVHPFREYKKYPVKKLIKQLGLYDYDVDAPLVNKSVSFKKVTIPLKQHIGAPANPIININDKVERGQLIGKIDDNKLGSNIHASIDGVVKEINENSITICTT